MAEEETKGTVAPPAWATTSHSEPTASRRRKLDDAKKFALSFAHLLSKLANEAPDDEGRRQLNRAAMGLRRRWVNTLEDNCREVARAIEKREAHTVREIAEDTGLGRGTVITALDAMMDLSPPHVRSEEPGGKRNCGRSGTQMWYFLTPAYFLNLKTPPAR